MRRDLLVRAVTLAIDVVRDSVLVHAEFQDIVDRKRANSKNLVLTTDSSYDDSIELRCREMTTEDYIPYDDCVALVALFEARRELEATS